LLIAKSNKKIISKLLVVIVALLLLLQLALSHVSADYPNQFMRFFHVGLNQISSSLPYNSIIERPRDSQSEMRTFNDLNYLKKSDGSIDISETFTELDPTLTRPNSPSNYCWVPGFIGPIQPSPLIPPTPFLYQPFAMDWDGSGRIWSSNMDHMYPNYQVSGSVASMGEILSGENLRDRYTINNHNYDYYVSLALEEEFGYDGHDGHDFRTFGVSGISALAAAGGLVVYTRKDCKTTYNALGCYVEIYHEQGYLTRYAHLDYVDVNTGDLVYAGEPIGVIGTTGASTGIHLHFSVYHWNPYRTVGSNQGEWEVTDPFGWDPWLPPEEQVADPLFNCNGEVSYNLWVGGWPQRVSEGPSQGSSGPEVFAVGGWLEDDLPYYCPPPSNGLPRDGVTLNNNSVTFSWSPPSCIGLDYYTFRVANHSDIDNPPWIIDHGVASNTSSLTETISTSYNGQNLYWAIWPHNSAGYGSKGGPWSFKIDTSSPPPPPPLPTGTWAVQYFNDKELSSQCSTSSFDRTFLFQDWGDAAPASTCNSNHWSARFTRQISFAGGHYDFMLEADDWARIFVDGNLVVNKWDAASQHHEGYDITAGIHEVKIEFADTEGAAKVSAWWWGPGFNVPHETQDPNQWFANYWINPTQWWDAFANVNEGTGVLNHDWEYDDPGWDMPTDNFSAKFSRTQYFECGTYRFILSHDDGAKFWLDGVLKIDRWSGAIGNYQFTLPMTQGFHGLQVDMYENGGAANIYFNWEQISNCIPSTPSLSYPNNISSLAWYTDLTLQWNAVPDATQYLVQLSGGPGVDISSGWLSSTQWHLGGLWPGVYSWSVTSRNDYGSSSPSASWSFTIEEVPAEPPASLDIIVDSITPSSYTPVVNEPVTFTVRIKNQGTADVTSGFYVDLFLDTEPGGCGSDGTHAWMVDSLAAGATKDLTVTHGGFDTSGAHNVYVFADSYCYFTEEDENNNIFGPVVINVTESAPSLPDLVVESITPSSYTPVVNELVTFTVRIKNQGSADVSSNFKIWLFQDLEIGPIHMWSVDELAAGTSLDLNFSYEGFNTVGDQGVEAWVDRFWDIDEDNDDNNWLGPVVIQVVESAPSLPDIIIESITPSSYTPVVDEPVTFVVRIKNQGATDVTSGFYVDLFLDTEPGGCGSDGADYWVVDALGAGSTIDLTFNYSGFDTSGVHNVYVFADSYCFISEEDENNNIPDAIVLNVTENTAPSDKTSYLPLILRSSQGQWNTILYESFEGDFPGPWEVREDSNQGYEWDDTSCMSSAGTWSGWVMDGGIEGEQLLCGSNYVDDFSTWMIYGPFDLSDATRAELSFDLWLLSEPDFDYVYWGASEDGLVFTVEEESGNSDGWVRRILDLSNVRGQNFVGMSQVWIGFNFASDSSVNYPIGAVVDEVLLRKCVGGTCP